MNRITALLMALLVQVALVTTASAAPAIPFVADTSPRDYIVAFKSSANSDGETTSLERKFGFVSKFRYRTALKGFAARLSPAVAAAVSRLPFVETVEPDGIARITADPMAAGDSAPTGIRRMGGASNSVVHGAASVAVAVIDTGIDLAHPDLNAVDGTNCITSGAAAQDDHGHGTHVAGTIGARNNGSGVVGVAPGTTIYAVKVLNSGGSGQWSQIICGIDWVTANRASKNIRVANMSLGGGSNTTMRTAIQNSTNAGVTYVVAAGNGNANLSNSSPANYTEVLTVTAVADSDGQGGGAGGSLSCWSGQPDDQYASFSNYATAPSLFGTDHRNHTIAGPGVCILSTARGGGYATMSGTSMATPHLAGAVALCLSGGACAGQSPSQIIQTMLTIAANKRSSDPSHGFTGVSGRFYGDMAWAGGDLGSPAPTPAFTLTSTTGSQTVPKGTNAVYAVNVNRTGGHTASVDLSVSGLPSGATASFSPDPTTGGSSTLTVNTTNSATGGPFTLTVQGNDGSVNRTVQVSLTVNAGATPNFSLSSSPTSRTITQGQATSYAITVNPTGGFSSSVQLSTSALPSGVSGSFTTNPATGSSTLNITTTAGAATGTTNITVTGVGGGITRTVQVSLTVNAAPTGNPDFTLSASPTSQSTPRGTAVNYTITVNPAGGFTGSVSFSVSGLGFLMNGSFTPTSSTTSTTLRVTSNSFWSSRGTRTLTITGTSGGTSRTVQVQLTLT